MFNENSQSLSPWACWSRVGEFAHVSFGCRSTTASRTAETMREPGRDSSRQQNTTSQTWKRRGRKRRRRKRKYSHAPGIKELPNFGSLREGEYDLKPAQYCVRCIRTLTGDILSIYIQHWMWCTYLITYSVEGLRHILLYVVETVVCQPCWRDQGLAVCSNRARLLRGWSQETI